MRSFLKFSSIATVGLFASSLAFSSAQAADLGGDCCADLEERVAELEATTVRKGNRKVSLTLSGHVNQALIWYENDTESDVYVLDNGNSMTRVRLVGSANFKPGWSAGFNLELGIRDSNSFGVGPDDADDSASILIRQAHWYIKSSQLGKLTVGQASTATDGISEIDLSGTFAVSYTAGQGPLTIANFSNGGGVAVFQLDGGRANIVRYDTPTFAGFTVSASWGEDDYWDAALRYAGEFNGLRIAAGIGYMWENDVEGNAQFPQILGSGERSGMAMSASLWHVPTGIFLTGSYSRILDVETNPLLALRNEIQDQYGWYVKAGLRRRFMPLGQTSLYGEYGQSQNASFAYGEVVTDYYGAGVVQYIDAAAMELYAGWRHYGSDVDPTFNVDELTVVTAGARIKF